MPKTDTMEHIKLNSRLGGDGFVERNLDKLKAFRSWVVFYPDLFLDLLKPETGGMSLHLDQRVFMRCDMRFHSIYGCFPRGYGKTFNEFADMVVACIAYPGIDIAITAQTKENAAEIVKDKYNEMLRYYPAIENEVKKAAFSKGDAKITFKNGSTLSVLCNQQSTKGQRRKRLRIEEAALLNNDLFEDVLAPVVEVGRYTCGKLAVIDPCELNQKIDFFTTPGWRQSDEYMRSLQMYHDMVDLRGDIVLGSDWMLPCWFGRGSTKAKVLERRRTSNPTAFAQNYGGEWTGTSSGALVNINKLLRCRTLVNPLTEVKPEDEVYMAVDVARSQNEANNQSSIAVGRVIRNAANNRVVSIELGYINNMSNTLNFANQALEVKRIKKRFNAKVVVVDGNGLGSGLVDELLKETIDPMTGESLGCWDTINTSNEPEDIVNAEQCLFDMKAQSYQTKVLTDFIDAVDSGVLRLLEQKQYDVLESDRDDEYQRKFIPYIQTDLLIEEVANLKLESNGKSLSVSREIGKIDKDRFSALAYLIFYIYEFENTYRAQAAIDFADAFVFRAPNIRA